MSWRRAWVQVMVSDGPVRVDQSNPAPGYRPRPAGFLAQVEPEEPAEDRDPQVWEGDYA